MIFWCQLWLGVHLSQRRFEHVQTRIRLADAQKVELRRFLFEVVELRRSAEKDWMDGNVAAVAEPEAICRRLKE